MIDVSSLKSFEPGDAKYVSQALGIAARAKGMTELSKQTGVLPEQVYKAIRVNSDSTLQTFMPLLVALGVRLGPSSAN